MNVAYTLEYLKAVVPIVVSFVVAIVTIWFYRWQIRISKEKLRQDLYERRFRIYIVFRELLILLIKGNDSEIKNGFRMANIARVEAQFVVDEPTVQAILDSICERVKVDIIGNIMYIEGMRPHIETMDVEVKQEFARRASILGQVKLTIIDQYYEELPRRFSKALRLTDFSK